MLADSILGFEQIAPVRPLFQYQGRVFEMYAYEELSIWRRCRLAMLSRQEHEIVAQLVDGSTMTESDIARLVFIRTGLLQTMLPDPDSIDVPNLIADQYDALVTGFFTMIREGDAQVERKDDKANDDNEPTDWGPMLAQVQREYGSEPATWLRMPLPILRNLIDNIPMVRAQESLQYVSRGNVVQAFGTKEGPEKAQQIIRNWEQDARGGKPEKLQPAPTLEGWLKERNKQMGMLRAMGVDVQIQQTGG